MADRTYLISNVAATTDAWYSSYSLYTFGKVHFPVTLFLKFSLWSLKTLSDTSYWQCGQYFIAVQRFPNPGGFILFTQTVTHKTKTVSPEWSCKLLWDIDTIDDYMGLAEPIKCQDSKSQKSNGKQFAPLLPLIGHKFC